MGGSDPSLYLITKGKWKNHMLCELDLSELKEMAQSRGKGKEAEFCRAFAQLKLLSPEMLNEPSGTANERTRPQQLQLVPFVPKRKIDTDKVVTEDAVSLSDVVFAFMSDFNFRPSLSSMGILKAIFMCFLICMMYPPLARLPGQACGVLVRALINRFHQVLSEFAGAFESEIALIANHIWNSFDTMLNGSPDDGKSFPFGRACVYASIGFLAQYVMRLKVFPTRII